MNLYYKASDDTINEYKKKYEKLKLQSDEIKINALQSLYLNHNITIDSEYKQYFLYSYSDNSEYGNHGGYSLVAINDKTNECIFAFYEW